MRSCSAQLSIEEDDFLEKMSVTRDLESAQTQLGVCLVLCCVVSHLCYHCSFIIVVCYSGSSATKNIMASASSQIKVAAS